ncbi:hypothetical protein RNZ50_09440 [Paracoccaceae bacterium Fryx2]|nr:hypothetical protein [Paracoccaceae bacterium Fryx2]
MSAPAKMVVAQQKRDHAKLVDAIIAGVPALQVRDRMIDLDARRQLLEAQLAATDAPAPVRFHPGMAGVYRAKVSALIAALGDADGMEMSKETLRALIEKIVLSPDPEGEGLLIDLHGALAGLLRFATGLPVVGPGSATGGPNSRAASDGISEAIDNICELVLVAGTGFEPVTFRL